MQKHVSSLNNSKISRCVGWAVLIGKFGSVQFLVQFLGFCSGLLLVRMMDKNDYALYTLATAMLGTMAVLADSGIGSGATSIAGRAWNDPAKLGEVVKTATALRRYFALAVVVVLSPVLFFWLGSHGAGKFESLLATVLVALTLYFQTGTGILGIVPRILLHTKQLQKVEFFTALVRLALVCAACLFFLNLATALITSSVAAAFQLAFLLRLTRRDFCRDVDDNPETKSEILRVVLRQAPNAIYLCIQSQVIIWLLGIFGSSEAIADAGALGRLAVVFTIVGNIIASIVMPRFSRCQSVELLRRRYQQVTVFLALALAVLVLTAWIFPVPMLWILGSQYQGLQNEFILMVAGQALNCLLVALSTLNLGRGWIVSPWIAIPSGLVTYTSLFLWIGVSTLHQVLLVGILASLVGIAINYLQAAFSMNRLSLQKE